MTYIKIFHNTQALSFSVGNSYYDYQFRHIFLDKKIGNYSLQVARHQEELRSEEKITDQKSLYILSL